FHGSAAPVLGYPGEVPVLDLVPFARGGSVVRYDDFHPGRGRESREFALPEPGSVSVGSATIGSDEDPAGIGIFLLAHALPPLLDSSDGKYRGVVIDAHGDPGAVVGHIVDSVGDCFTVGF